MLLSLLEISFCVCSCVTLSRPTMKFKWWEFLQILKWWLLLWKFNGRCGLMRMKLHYLLNTYNTPHIPTSSFVGQVAYFTSPVKFDILVLIAQRINSISLCWWAKSYGFKHWYHTLICFGHINNTYHISMILKKVDFLFYLQKLCKMEKTKKKVLEFVYFWSLTAQLFYFIFSHNQL